MMKNEIKIYNDNLSGDDKGICDLLATTIDAELTSAENKIWHAHPVWFLDGNPIVGYKKQKKGIRLIFWSGADFGEDALNEKGKTFKDASIFYNLISEVYTDDLKRWLVKAKSIQWDYKNIVKRKGKLEKIILK